MRRQIPTADWRTVKPNTSFEQGLCAMLMMALQKGGEPVPSGVMAEILGVSDSYLKKTLRKARRRRTGGIFCPKRRWIQALQACGAYYRSRCVPRAARENRTSALRLARPRVSRQSPYRQSQGIASRGRKRSRRGVPRKARRNIALRPARSRKRP